MLSNLESHMFPLHRSTTKFRKTFIVKETDGSLSKSISDKTEEPDGTIKEAVVDFRCVLCRLHKVPVCHHQVEPITDQMMSPSTKQMV